MKKFIKIAICSLALASLAVGLAACGNPEDDSSNPDTGNQGENSLVPGTGNQGEEFFDSATGIQVADQAAFDEKLNIISDSSTSFMYTLHYSYSGDKNSEEREYGDYGYTLKVDVANKKMSIAYFGSYTYLDEGTVELQENEIYAVEYNGSCYAWEYLPDEEGNYKTTVRQIDSFEKEYGYWIMIDEFYRNAVEDNSIDFGFEKAVWNSEKQAYKWTNGEYTDAYIKLTDASVSYVLESTNPEFGDAFYKESHIIRNVNSTTVEIPQKVYTGIDEYLANNG